MKIFFLLQTGGVFNPPSYNHFIAETYFVYCYFQLGNIFNHLKLYNHVSETCLCTTIFISEICSSTRHYSFFEIIKIKIFTKVSICIPCSLITSIQSVGVHCPAYHLTVYNYNNNHVLSYLAKQQAQSQIIVNHINSHKRVNHNS